MTWRVYVQRITRWASLRRSFTLSGGRGFGKAFVALGILFLSRTVDLGTNETDTKTPYLAAHCLTTPDRHFLVSASSMLTRFGSCPPRSPEFIPNMSFFIPKSAWKLARRWDNRLSLREIMCTSQQLMELTCKIHGQKLRRIRFVQI